MRSPLARRLHVAVPRRIATILVALAGVATVVDVAPATPSPSPTEGDTVRSRLQDAGRGLVDSSPRTTPPLIAARARGHLAAFDGFQPEDAPGGLATCRDERSRLAWLEAALAADGLEIGSSPDAARAATRRALDLLAAAAPDDEAVVLDRTIEAILAGDATVEALSPADFVHRPFATSPDAVCNRLATGDESIRLAMLELADDGSRPAVIAAILAADPDPTEAVAARIDTFDHSLTGIGSDVVLELARREAASAMLAYVGRHPEAIALPGIRVAAIATVAVTDPEVAIALAGGEAVIERVPPKGRTAIRIGLARGYADRDPDEAYTQADTAGQLDDRIEALLAIRRADDDPDRTLEDVKSCRTLAPGRLVSALASNRLARDRTIEAIADLYRTGRFDLAYSLLAPNTTEPSRPADGWLPTRIELMSAALAAADAAPDAWIPLLESVPRIAGVDGQVAALAAIADGLAAVLPDDADLPDPLRSVLSDALVEIALRG